MWELFDNVSRLDHGVDEYFELNSPATVERVRIACSDKILKVCKHL